MKYFLAGLALLALMGCMAEQQATLVSTLEKDANTAQEVIQVADSALPVVDALVNAAAPGSKTSQTLNNVTVIANKINGIVQSVTIPVTPIPVVAPAAAPAAATTTP